MSTVSETRNRSTAMTAFTAVPRYWTRWLRVYWWALKPLERVQSDRGRWLIAHTPLLKDVDSLTALTMISFARWSVETMPARSSSNGSRPQPYVLFETNFNGDNDQYLEGFSLVVPSSMRLTWRLGPLGGFHVPDVGRVSRFLRYVNQVKLRSIYGYYCAYPNASTKMIRAALALRQRVGEFNRDFANEGDPATFLREYRKLLTNVQKIRNPRLDRPDKAGAGTGTGTGTLSVLAPVVEARKDELRRNLEALSVAPEEVVPTDRTHFARWILVDGLESAPNREEDRTPYLLFSAWFDYRKQDSEEQGQEQYVKALHRSLAGREAIWEHCGFKGSGEADQFWDEMRNHRVKLGIPFYGYEGMTVKEVRDALECAERFSAFAVDSQGREAGALQQTWRDTFLERRAIFRERRKLRARAEHVVA
jgi:hypothetical protein